MLVEVQVNGRRKQQLTMNIGRCLWKVTRIVKVSKFNEEFTRSINTGRGKLESNRVSSDNVIQSWTKEIISERGEVKQVQGVVKRPPVATFEARLSPDSMGGGTAKGKKLRRRLADNSWTSDPMDEKIIWVDCEMSGLDADKDKLLEIGVIITDGDLNVIAIQDSIVFHVSDAVLAEMSDWCIKHHGDSGLTNACRRSDVTHEAADQELLKFVQKHTIAGDCPMAGNTIGGDREFIKRQLPLFHSHFHYRNIDVSTIKELTRRWYPKVFGSAPRKRFSHRVIDDIEDSIAELKYYRSTVFNTAEAANMKCSKYNK